MADILLGVFGGVFSVFSVLVGKNLERANQGKAEQRKLDNAYFRSLHRLTERCENLVYSGEEPSLQDYEDWKTAWHNFQEEALLAYCSENRPLDQAVERLATIAFEAKNYTQLRWEENPLRRPGDYFAMASEAHRTLVRETRLLRAEHKLRSTWGGRLRLLARKTKTIPGRIKSRKALPEGEMR